MNRKIEFISILSTENITKLLSWKEVIKLQAGKNVGENNVEV